MYKSASIDDFKFVYYLYMHPIINPHLLYEIMTEQEFYPIYINLIKEKILYIFQVDDKNVGMFKLKPHTYRSAHVTYVGSVAIDPTYAGKGMGVKMMNTIIDIAKEQKIIRLELSVGQENHRARELYKKVGFEEEGVLRNYTYLKKENKYINEVLMSFIVI
jgi:L-phenylalanine/L-methionine N-acetyltransferase